MKTRIDDAPRGWFLDYHAAAVSAGVERGHRVRRPRHSDGWVTHNAKFDTAWFRAHGYVVPQMYAAEQVTERKVDYGGGLSRIDIDRRSAVALQVGRKAFVRNQVLPIAWTCLFFAAVVVAAFILAGGGR